MRTRRKWALAIVVLFGSVALAHADGLEQTHQTVPSASFSFMSDLQTFLKREDANRYADLFSNVVSRGGLHGTAAGLTATPSTLTAYPSGYYVTEDASITYPDNSICWVIAHTAMSGNLASFVRVANTHYLINCSSSAQPPTPDNAVWLMRVTTSGGAITAVLDYRQLATHISDACVYHTLDAAVAAYSTTVGELLIGCRLPVQQDTTVPATLHLVFAPRGQLDLEDVTTDLTINGRLTASPTQQIFTGNGRYNITFAAGTVAFITPQNYGALGDGVANDGAIIQGILTDWSSTATLYFPCGTYNGSASITIPAIDGIRLVGAGSCTVLKNTATNNGIFGLTAGADKFELSYMKLEGSGTLAVLGRGLIYINSSGAATPTTHAHIHHVWFAAPSTSGISGNCLTDSTIESNFFYVEGVDYGEHGIYLSNAGCPSARLKVHNNYLYNTATGNSAGITIRQWQDSSIVGNTIIGWKYNILPVIDTAGAPTGIIISDNLLIDASTDSVNFFYESGTDLPRFIKLDHNLLTGAGRNGIRADQIADCSISDNLITRNAESGMRMNGMVRCLIASNKITDNDYDTDGSGGDDSSGIRLNTNNTDNKFLLNDVTVSTTASYQKYGISIGSSGNTGNFFIANIWADNRTAERDVGSSTNTWLNVDTNGSWSTGRVDNALIGLPEDRGTCTFSAATSKVCSLGTTQPDNLYYVLTTCNANKTFWVNTKTTTTFTLNASSSSSDNCDWILLR